MKGFTRFALRLVPGFLVTSMLLPPGLCVAQEVGTPSTPAGNGSGSVFAPSGWVEVITPIQDRIDLKLFGFYIGELDVPVAQIDAAIRVTKFLTITPSYMYYSVPASGLNKLAPRPVFTDSYHENQFRIDGTLTFSIQKLEISARNMYVRRYRPAPADDMNRYRGRIGITYPVAVMGNSWKPFAWYEAFYDGGGGGWNKDRLSGGVTLPLVKGVWFQPSYMFEKTDRLKDVNYLLFGLIVRTGR
jgi:hypothetical protein